MSLFRRSTLVALASQLVEFRHLHQEIEVPVTTKNPTGRQKRLFATVASLPIRGTVDQTGNPDVWIVGIAARKDGVAASRRIGRDVAGGRLLKQFAIHSNQIPAKETPAYTGNVKYRPEITSVVLTHSQYEAFMAILDAKPENLFSAIRMVHSTTRTVENTPTEIVELA